jgi:hypothetical protein
MRLPKQNKPLAFLVCWLQIEASLFRLVVLSATARMSVAQNRMVCGPTVEAGPNSLCLGSNDLRVSRGGGDRQQHLNLILGEIPSVGGDLRFCLGVDRPYKTPSDDIESKRGGDGDRRRLNLGYVTTTPRARK